MQSFKRPPELTDDWVAANTDYKTIDEYKASVRAQLEQEAQDQADSSLRSTAWNTVYTNSEVVEYPEKDVEEAVKTFKKQAEAYAKQGNMELEDFVESQGVSMDDFEAQCQQYAQAKVKQNLLIQGIMDAEGMTLEDEESLAIQNQLVEQYASGDLAVLIDTYGQVAVDESIGLMRVQDFIIANANYDQTAADTSAEGETHRLLREQKQQIMQMAVRLTDRARMAGIQQKSRKLVQPQIQAQQRMLQQIHRMTVRRIDGCCL